MSEVLVVGAGPTGLATGCLLRAAGVDVRVVDRRPELSGPEDSVLLWSATLGALGEIGVGPPVQLAGRAVHAARYVDRGRVLARVPLQGEHPHLQPVVLGRATLQRLLCERLAQLGVRVEWDTEALQIGTSGHGVSLVLDRRGHRAEAGAAYVVGCDGADSTVRGAAGVGWEDVGAAGDGDSAYAEIEARTRLDASTAHVFRSGGGVVMLLPTAAGTWSVVGYARDLQWGPRPGTAQLQALLDSCGAAGLVRARRVVSFVPGDGSRGVAATYRAGRLLLAGAAAHAHPSRGGEGLNLGLQDAHNLAWKLALVVRGAARDRLLDSYDAERRPVARAALRDTAAEERRVLAGESRMARWVRGSVPAQLRRDGELEHRLARAAVADADYTGSPLTTGSRLAGADHVPGRPFRVAPGVDAAAAVRGDGAITLVLVAGRDGPAATLPVLHAVADRHAPRVRALAVPGAPGTGARPAAGYVLGVRPDGHIGYRGPASDRGSLEAWLRDGVGLLPGRG
ncbi:FAD-dependent monooxygenase [Motilibacter deserti]|uniref:NAD(P)-binding protein n=1 Tax=Motilibacter deserti TaxID=2714956 RepID=A0ABX0H0M7_9ACTN|nr:FAD-dependent monooxygenase [Motilibacter deserti]NHC15579.1 NAD(P)-binding protein [Motilibacter deserti]